MDNRTNCYVGIGLPRVCVCVCTLDIAAIDTFMTEIAAANRYVNRNVYFHLSDILLRCLLTLGE